MKFIHISSTQKTIKTDPLHFHFHQFLLKSNSFKQVKRKIRVKMSFKLSLLILILFLGFSNNQSWSLNLFLFSLYFLLHLSQKFWLVPGGFAWRNHCTNPSKLKGPTGWPILGIIPQMGSLAHRKLASMATSYGAKRVMALSLGTTRLIISSDPETAKEMLSSPSFSDRPVKESARLLMFERAIGFSPSGTYWRHLRRIAANNMFSPRRISSLEGLRDLVAEDMVARVRKEMERNGKVEMRGILQMGSLRNIIGSVFGQFECVDIKVLEDMVRKGYELLSTYNWEDHIPLKFLDVYGVKRKCHELASKVKVVIGQIVEERKNKGGYGHGGDGNDFLSALLSLPEEDQLSDSDMTSVLWEMIFRGTDTVAILLEWTMSRMVLHPHIQSKAQQELNKHVGNKRHVQESDIANLPYLQAIVKEVLRMHPPGPLLSWARLATHDVHIDKLFVPAGTIAMVNMWAIAHDPSIWKDPWAFRPERFIEEDVSIMGSNLRLAPFGSGRRVCPGRALGLTVVHMWLACFLQQFQWLPSKPMDLSECLKLSLEMKAPLVCRVVPQDD